MYPSIIERYEAPATIDQARRAFMASGEDALYIAGGMSLMQALKSRVLQAKTLIDLQRVDELRGVEVGANGISIGAMTRYRDVVESAASIGPAYAALVDAAAHVGDRQVRNRGTVGGSLAWNFVTACVPIASLACGARVNIVRLNGDREAISITDFLLGPMTTALEPGDLLVGIEFPKPSEVAGSAYRKWGIVHDALPTVGVSVYVQLSPDGNCSVARIAVGGLADGPKRAIGGEKALVAADLGDGTALRECARTAAAECQTSQDPWLSAEYKTLLTERLCHQMIQKAIERAKEHRS